MQIEMSIKGLMVDPVTNMPIVILRDQAGQKVLPIWVGMSEANAIALQIENISTPRPMTHDLLRNVIHDLKATRPQDRRLRPPGQHLLRAHLPRARRRDAGHRCAPERRDCAGAADAGADLRRGDGHRPRQDGGLLAGEERRGPAAQVAGEPRPGRPRLQDVAPVGSRQSAVGSHSRSLTVELARPLELIESSDRWFTRPPILLQSCSFPPPGP